MYFIKIIINFFKVAADLEVLVAFWFLVWVLLTQKNEKTKTYKNIYKLVEIQKSSLLLLEKKCDLSK